MNQWVDRLKATNIDGLLTQLLLIVDQADDRDPKSPGTADRLGRIRALHRYLADRVSRIDPMLAPVAPVTTAGQYISSAASNLTTFVSNGNESYLQPTNDALENASLTLAPMPLLPAPHGDKDPAASARAYLQSVSTYTEQVSADVTKVRTAVAALEARLSEVAQVVEGTRNTVTQLTAQQQEQFASAQERRGAEHTQAEGERGKAFLDSEGDRKEAASDALGAFKEHSDGVIATLRQDIAKERDDVEKARCDLDVKYRRTADDLVDHLERLKAEADKLVGVIGERGVTSHYQTAARQARVEMWIWQGLVVVTLGCLIAFAIFEFLPAVQGAMNWGAFTARMFVSLGCIALAGYAGAEARNAQQQRTRNREREMHFAALGPYLSTLPEVQQQEFRLKYADVAFGMSNVMQAASPEEPSSRSGVPSPRLDINEISTTLFKLASEFAKGGK